MGEINPPMPLDTICVLVWHSWRGGPDEVIAHLTAVYCYKEVSAPSFVSTAARIAGHKAGLPICLTSGH